MQSTCECGICKIRLPNERAKWKFNLGWKFSHTWGERESGKNADKRLFSYFGTLETVFILYQRTPFDAHVVLSRHNHWYTIEFINHWYANTSFNICLNSWKNIHTACDMNWAPCAVCLIQRAKRMKFNIWFRNFRFQSR